MVRDGGPSQFGRFLRIALGIVLIVAWLYGIFTGAKWASSGHAFWFMVIAWLLGGGKKDTKPQVSTASSEPEESFAIDDLHALKQAMLQMTSSQRQAALESVQRLPAQDRLAALMALTTKGSAYASPAPSKYGMSAPDLYAQNVAGSAGAGLYGGSVAGSGSADLFQRQIGGDRADLFAASARSSKPDLFQQRREGRPPDLFQQSTGGGNDASTAMLSRASAENRARIEALHRAIPRSQTRATLQASMTSTLVQLRSRPSLSKILLAQVPKSQRMLSMKSTAQRRIQQAFARQHTAKDPALLPLRARSAKLKADGTLGGPLQSLRTAPNRLVRG